MTALKAVADEFAGEPTAEIYTITPAVARRWLSRNVRNRNIRPTTVAAYARDMESGRWQVTGEAIKFDTNGALSDGQHRLSAVIRADVPIKMLVIRGVDPEAQAVMDSGVKRSVVDQFSLGGKSHPSILAAAARLALSEPDAGFVTEARKAPTNSELAAFAADNEDALTKGAEMASHFYPSFGVPPSVLCVVWMRLTNLDPSATADFFTSIADCQTDGRGDARLTLIKRLAQVRKSNERLTQAMYLSLIYRTWNAWRTGKPLHNLPTRIGGDMVRVPERLR